MTLGGKWRELHRKRFAQLPEDCGGPAPLSGDEDLRDWSHRATTPDQYRIERYIDRFDLRDKRILHIGIGNSGLAQRFYGRVGQIVGTTVDQSEMNVARCLGFANYHVVLHNKYDGDSRVIDGRFDFIVDNNPTSPCCCMTHLAELFRFFESRLAEGGQVVTDRVGLAWIPEGSHPRWSLDFADFAAVAAAAGLDAWRIDRNTYVLCHGKPSRAEFAPRLRSMIRRAQQLANRAARRGPRRVLHILRTTAAEAHRALRK